MVVKSIFGMSSSTRGAARRSARSSAACTTVGGPAKRLRPDGGRKKQSQCANCGSSITDDSGLFRFLPCRHGVCSLCAYTSQVDRGSNAHKCPVEGCRQYSMSCDYVVGGVIKKNIPNKASNDPEWLKKNNPREYLLQQHLPEFNRRAANGAISLSCTKLFVEANCLQSKTVTCTLSYNNNKDGTYEILNPRRAIMELRLFGIYLHRPIVIASNGPKEVPVMSPKELMEFRSKDGDTSLLDALLYSMSTGHVDFNWEKLLEKDSQDYQKKFLSAMVASDVLLQNVRDGINWQCTMWPQRMLRKWKGDLSWQWRSTSSCSSRQKSIRCVLW